MTRPFVSLNMMKSPMLVAPSAGGYRHWFPV